MKSRIVLSGIVLSFFLSGPPSASIARGEGSDPQITRHEELNALIGSLAQYDALLYACAGTRDAGLRQGLADGGHMIDWQEIGQGMATGYSARARADRGFPAAPQSVEDMLVAYDGAFDQGLASVRDSIRRRDEQRRADPCTDQRLEQQRSSAGMQAAKIRHPSFMLAATDDPDEALATLSAEVRESLLTEQEQVTNYCRRQSGMFSTLYDCDCVGDRFLEVRLVKDPYTPALRLINDLARQCPNRPALFDYGTASCMSNSARFSDIADSVCECAGERFADEVAQSSRPTFSWMGNLAVRVTEECRQAHAQGGQ